MLPENSGCFPDISRLFPGASEPGSQAAREPGSFRSPHSLGPGSLNIFLQGRWHEAFADDISKEVRTFAKMNYASIKVIAFTCIESSLFPRELYTFAKTNHASIKISFIKFGNV